MATCDPRHDAKQPAPAAGSIPLPVLPTPGRRAAFGSHRTGRLRALVLAGVWLFMGLHVVQWLAFGTTLAPIEPSESMQTAKDGIVTVGAVFFAAALVSTAILGRWFCGWGCHWVAVQDATAWALARAGLRPKPFRSRLLLWLPLALALYMFAWPILYRFAVAPWVQPDLRWPGFTTHFTTADFWATFPGWAMGIPFLLVSGVLVVWLLGSKGYCTYGCPYGGFFAPAEELAPFRIVVDHDRCHQCGHCTAVCTSNVRVHEEVRDFGMVVDPGCMKCMDCVGVCPNQALRFGMGKPAIAIDRAGSRAADAAARRFDLTLAEEIGIALVALAALLAARGTLLGVPLLFASGITACAAFISWKAWRTLRDANVAFHGHRLRIAGRIAPAGWAWLAASALMLACIAWVAALNAVTWRAMQLDARVDVPAEVVFSEAPMDLPPARAADARAALAWYARASAIPEGISPFAFAQPRIDLQRAFLHAALHEMPQAELLYRRALDADPALQAAAAGVARAIRADPARQAEAAAFYEQSLSAHPAWQPMREEQIAWLGTIGEYAAGIRSARAGLEAVPNLLAMRRLSLELTEHGAGPQDVAEGVALIRRTLEIEPGNAFAHAALARGLARLGQVDEAMAEFDRAIQLDPSAEILKAMRDEAKAMLH